jgi:alpha-1,6-mannosyltransferase
VVIIITLVVGIFGPTANGDRFALFQIVDATLASSLIVAVLIALTYTRLPWRQLPPQSPETNGETVIRLPAPVAPEAPPATPDSEAAPDAYADST